MEWLFNWTGWLIFGFVLLILELVLPGVFIMWWGFAAVILSGLVAFFPELPQGWQAAIFAVLAIIFSLIWWKYQHDKDVQDDAANQLNSREHSMLGAQGVVVEIFDNGIARGKFGDTTWRMVGENLHIGETVKVQQVDGITLKVIKVA